MTSVVTGAFGYIGKSIARKLLEAGVDVRTVTTHLRRADPFDGAVRASPYDFDHPARLTDHLRGATTLYNTYWIRFEQRGVTFAQAVRNTSILFECARSAGVEKVVHISVTRASEGSLLPYYAGKARQESALKDSGLPYSILRPTLVFGDGDILVNNIAWLMRHFPVFPIFGSGAYRLQPVFVEDLAALAIQASRDPTSATTDVIGPEEFTFRKFLEVISTQVRPQMPLIHFPPWAGIAAGRLIGVAVRDVILTADELRGLMDEMLTSNQTPNGSKLFSDWVVLRRETLGRRYASELARHFSPTG
jgi:NADH dehydrogenase